MLLLKSQNDCAKWWLLNCSVFFFVFVSSLSCNEEKFNCYDMRFVLNLSLNVYGARARKLCLCKTKSGRNIITFYVKNNILHHARYHLIFWFPHLKRLENSFQYSRCVWNFKYGRWTLRWPLATGTYITKFTHTHTHSENMLIE